MSGSPTVAAAKPLVVSVDMTSENLTYLQLLLTGGVISGALGDTSVNPYVRPLLDALYNVMSGAVPTVVTLPGPPVQVLITYQPVAAGIQAYSDAETKSLESSNLVNQNQTTPIVPDI